MINPTNRKRVSRYRIKKAVADLKVGKLAPITKKKLKLVFKEITDEEKKRIQALKKTARDYWKPKSLIYKRKPLPKEVKTKVSKKTLYVIQCQIKGSQAWEDFENSKTHWKEVERAEYDNLYDAEKELDRLSQHLGRQISRVGHFGQDWKWEYTGFRIVREVIKTETSLVMSL